MSSTELEKKMVRMNLAPPIMKAKESANRRQPSNRQPRKSVGKNSSSSSTSRSKTAPMKLSSAPAKSDVKPSGPTIFGIMMTRQLARNYVNRFRQGRQQLISRPIPPTYQLEPTVKFDPLLVKPLMKKVIDARMRTFRYQQTTAALLAKILATECKDAVKTLNFSRYKLVCQVFVGEKKEQSAAVSSQCAWDPNTDNVVSYSWQSANVYCIATMHAIYHD